MKHYLQKTMLLLCILVGGASNVWAQSDYSAVETSNCTLTAGTNGSSCTVNGKSGIKVGTSSKGGDMTVTVPSGAKYLHVHAAAWNGVTGLSLNITPNTNITPTSIDLTEDAGISNSSPFTLSGDAEDFYFVITFTKVLTSETTFTFATSAKKRFVIWGVNSEEPAVPITSIAFSEPKTASIGVGGTTTLSPTVLPTNHTEVVDWESDAPEIATVNSSGVVTGVAAGTAHITAKSHGNPSTIYDVCTVTVTAAVPVTGVSLKSSTTLLLGGTETLEATVLPNDATNKNVTWSSADGTKVSVDEHGVITGLALTGEIPVNITVTTEDGSFEATCAVTVNPVPVSSVGLNKTSAELVVGKTLTLSETVLPDNATDKSVTWESDDETVATVDDDGKVTAVAEGTATITVKSVADPTKKAECTITVTDGSIDLSTTGEITFGSWSTSILGSSYGDRECALTGSDANTYYWNEVQGYYNNSGWQIKKTDGKVTSPTIKSDYGFTISVTNGTNDVIISDGTNSGKNSLTTTKTSTAITIKGDGAYAVFTDITITPLKQPVATEVSITDPGTLAKDATGTFAYTATTEEDNTASWTSATPGVIRIDNASTGAYTALSRGTSKITVTLTPTDATTYDVVKAERIVNVAAPVVITANDVEMTYGDAAKAIGATTSAEYGGTLTYESGNTSVATVDATGKVTAVAAGTTTITISAPADAEHLYTAGDDKVINVTVSAPTGSTTAATYTQTADDYEELTSAATGWTYDAWTTSNSYGACSTAGTAGQLITKDYTIPVKANPCIYFEHTGKSFDNPSTACKLYVQEGSETPVELTIPNYFTGSDWNYVESGDIDISAYIGKTVHFIFDYNPSTGNEGKWEVKNFGIYYDAFSIKLNASGYATYCTQYPLDFSDHDTADYSAWQITALSSTTITFSQITGAIKGGQGILLKGTPNSFITLTSANGSTVLEDNKLVGTMAPTAVAADTYYGLSGDTFKKVAAGTVPAGKALLPASEIGAGVKVLNLVFDDATGISTLERVVIDNDAWYDLQGRRIAQPNKGIYIHNGKKVFIK